MLEKTKQETKDTLAANGLILHERADGTCYFTSFAKSCDDAETDSEGVSQ